MTLAKDIALAVGIAVGIVAVGLIVVAIGTAFAAWCVERRA